MDKKRIRNYILAFIIIIAIPNITFFALNGYLTLIGNVTMNPILYVISSITGFSTICFLITMNVWSIQLGLFKKLFLSFLFLFVFPLIEIFTLGFITPIPILTEHVAEAMFGYAFGITVGVAFELLQPQLTNSNKKMNREKIERFLGILFMIIGLSIILITIILLGNNYIDIQQFSILLPLGFALISIGLAFDADSKALVFSNFFFLQAAKDFEYDRVMFVNPGPQQSSLELFLWFSKNDLERANEFNKKIIKPQHQEKLYNYFCVTLWQILEGSAIAWMTMSVSHKKKIIDMCWIAREFKKTSADEEKVIGIFEQYVSKLKTETEEEFLSRLKT